MAQMIRDLMTRNVQSCPSSTSLVDAARTMRDEDIGDVIVLDDDGGMRGIVTDRDIAIRAVAEGADLSSLTVGDICSGDVVTVSPDTQAEEAVRMMREHAIRRLPVTDGGRPVGFVSIGDLAIERDSGSALADISAAQPDH